MQAVFQKHPLKQKQAAKRQEKQPRIRRAPDSPVNLKEQR
ncbi:hypothetical protein M703_10370 [Neisseria gonorrhoeae SK29344]|nr:hypothetical protein M717_01540 [Neisseria gonorrhoeae SK33414]KLR79434.1 hypothetical protein M679_02270 [Neisseria gonorrhoeae SK7842]KLR90552.1 hypothetical protein M677_05905 [Neisseria gonorrhoeae SK6987]KLS09329.1 hypothetical protein M703_10370 [Neisseria gonorrhoeae SK29344]KLS35992.1 hypothetical protein M723_08190 [Neisseria gonorrhoeae ATL_2011_01_03]KLS87860.1 hypothetical protein M773_08730 [Neisseria gonorrhoeae MU_NG4]